MNDLVLKIVVPADLVGKMLQGGVASVVDSCTVTIMGNEQKEPVKTTEDGPRVRKKFIKFTCPDCGKVNFAIVEENGGKYQMVCRGCNMDYTFFDRDLTRVEYRCPECDEERYFFMPYMDGMTVKTDNCKCGETIGLKYDVTTGKFVMKEAEE